PSRSEKWLGPGAPGRRLEHPRPGLPGGVPRLARAVGPVLLPGLSRGRSSARVGMGRGRAPTVAGRERGGRRGGRRRRILMPTSDLPTPFDHASRGLVRRAGLPMLAWLLRVAVSSIRFERWLDTRLSLPGWPERVCDTIAHVWREDEGGFPWAAPIEF